MVDVVIEVQGGCVVSVRAKDPAALKVIIVDRDDEQYMDEYTDIPAEYLHCDEYVGDPRWIRSKCDRRDFILQLTVGDEVFWNDPDEGLCSRTGKIFQIDTDDGKVEDEDTVIWLKFGDGGEAQVYVREVQ